MFFIGVDLCGRKRIDSLFVVNWISRAAALSCQYIGVLLIMKGLSDSPPSPLRAHKFDGILWHHAH